MQAVTSIRHNRLKNHLSYDIWKYVLVVALCWFGWELIYTATAYRSPQDKRVDVYIMSSTASEDSVQAFLQPLWEQAVPDMELVEGVILMSGGADDYYTTMNLTTKIAAGEGDIYLLPQDVFKQYALSGAFLPLDQYVDQGEIRIDGIDTATARLTLVNDETGEAASHLYGVPTESLYGLMNGMQYDNRDAVMAIAVNNGNDENVVRFMDALIQAGHGEKPDWLNEAADSEP